MAFDRAGTVLVSAGSDKTVRTWNGKNGAVELLSPRRLFMPWQLHRMVPRWPPAVLMGPSWSGKSAAGGVLLTMASFLDMQGNSQWLAFVPEGYVEPVLAPIRRCSGRCRIM